MEISALNRIAGTVVEVKKGKATTHVRIGTDHTELAVVITSSSVEEMGLEVGDRITARFREVDVLLMKGSASISAGNRFKGRVLDIKKGTVTAEVTLDVQGQRIVAVVARTAAEEMRIEVGDEVTAFVREIDVLLSKEGRSPRISARNRIPAIVAALRPGTVTTEVTLDAGERQVLALLARSAVEVMELSERDHVIALVREGDILVIKE